jgi:5-methylcytosine-specific restriction endonuclease McrA
VSRGGSNWPANIQLLCAWCNRSKGAKLMEEWRGRANTLCA